MANTTLLVGNRSNGYFPPVIALSFDVDWAPDHILEDLYDLLLEVRRPVTFFMTHDSPANRKLLTLPGAEAAIHPNFFRVKKESEVLLELKTLFPQAVGARNHVLYYHSSILPLLHKAGIQYFSNDLLFLRKGLEPFYDWTGMVRLPFYWEDDVHCLYYGNDFALRTLALRQPGLKIFNFHPVHLYLNTKDFAAYGKIKSVLNHPEKAKNVRSSGKGIRTLFTELIRATKSTRGITLGEMNRAFRKKREYPGEYEKYLSQFVERQRET